ncbi:MAG: hypothetical protein NC084_03220 [Bacteroides sp.]|nr:M42 family peptidase [Eubacterium sp.]MCM1417582.1 M42 family peptidase [Roseburia sp.]MCM1461707.1 hypothetical protein [Bacteroides sp.]
MLDLELIRALSSLNGVSGDEDAVRDFIADRLPADCIATTDPLGNLIVTKKGKTSPKNKVMLCAHMDEVGLIVTQITDEGLLKFAPVGGISPSAVYGRRVVFSDGVRGVIAAKATHMVKGDEKEKQPKLDELWIDVGASSREEAGKKVRAGDRCTFESEFFLFGEDKMKGKALDDRVGCAILLSLLGEGLPYDLTAVFTVQEEIGTRGAACVAYTVRPDYAIVLETTTACDLPDIKGADRVCAVGGGAVVSYMDRATIYDKAIYRLALDLAADKKIAAQTKTKVAGGNDSGAIHKAVGGIRTAAISVPTRYLHTPACVMSRADAEAVDALARALYERLSAL